MHKNSLKRIYGDYVYFITSCVDDKIESFREKLFCELWINELKMAKEMHKFQLYAFCLNYNHFHLLIKPNNKIADYSEIVKFLKRNFSQNVNKIMGYNKFILHYGDDNANNLSSVGDNAHCRLQSSWRFRMDNFISDLRNEFMQKHGINHNFPKFKWQKSFHDHIIRNENDFNNYWNYTMHNFKKHNLPDDWQYTGLKFPEMIDEE